MDNVVRDVDYKLPVSLITNNFPLYLEKEQFNSIASFIRGDYDEIDNSFFNLLFKTPIDKTINSKDISLLYSNKNNEYLLGKLSDEYYYNNSKDKLLIFLRPTNPNHDMVYFKNMVAEVEKTIDNTIVRYPNVSYNLTGMAKMMDEQQTMLNKKIVITSIIAFILILMLFIISYRKILSPILASDPVIWNNMDFSYKPNSNWQTKSYNKYFCCHFIGARY